MGDYRETVTRIAAPLANESVCHNDNFGWARWTLDAEAKIEKG